MAIERWLQLPISSASFQNVFAGQLLPQRQKSEVLPWSLMQLVSVAQPSLRICSFLLRIQTKILVVNQSLEVEEDHASESVRYLYLGEPFWGCSQIGGKKVPLPKICHTYPTMIKLGTIIPYLKKIQKMYESYDTPFKFC